MVTIKSHIICIWIKEYHWKYIFLEAYTNTSCCGWPNDILRKCESSKLLHSFHLHGRTFKYSLSVKNETHFRSHLSLQVFDMLVRDGTLWPMRMLRTYKSLRTLLFMIISGIVVDSMYLNRDSVFWLFKPLKKYRKPLDNHTNNRKPAEHHHICHHKNSCDSHIAHVRTPRFLAHGMDIRQLVGLLIIVAVFLGFQNIFNTWNWIGNPKINIWQHWIHCSKSNSRILLRNQTYKTKFLTFYQWLSNAHSFNELLAE